MKNFTLLGTGLACLLVSSVTSLAIQCKVDFDDRISPNRIKCTPAGVVTFKGGAKVPLYNVSGISTKPLRNHHPYIGFYLPRSLAHNFIVLYDGAFELVPKSYTHIGITSNEHTFGITYSNANETGCVGQGIAGGSPYCSNVLWFHDPESMRHCGGILYNKILLPGKDVKVLRKDYRHRTVVVRTSGKRYYFFSNNFCNSAFYINLPDNPSFEVVQGTNRPHITLPEDQADLRGFNEVDIVLPENQENLARILANYYYYMYTH